MLYRLLRDIPDFSSFCSTPPTATLLQFCWLESEHTPVLLSFRRCSLAIWPTLLTQDMSPTSASTSAVSTRWSITPRERTASTSRMTWRPQSRPLRIPMVFLSDQQPAVASSPHQQMLSPMLMWTFTCALVSCVTVPPLHLRTFPQGPWVSSKTVFTHLSSHRVTPIAHCTPGFTSVAEQVTAHFVDFASYSLYAPYSWESELVCFRQWQEEETSTCDRVIHCSLILCGAMAWSAVSSVFYLRDAAGNHAETRTDAKTCYGAAASFHG